MQHEANATPRPTSSPDAQPDRPGQTMPGQTMPADRPCRRGPSPRASPPCCTPCASCSATAAISPRPRRTAPPAPTSTPSPPASAPGGCIRSWPTCNVGSCVPWRWSACCSHAPRPAGISVLSHPASAPPRPPIRRPGQPRAGTDPPADPAEPAGRSAAEPPPEPPVTRKTPARPSRPPGWNDPELFMPTLEELEAQARRRPIGRTLVDICLDLAVVPGFCTGRFWHALFDSIRLHRGSIAC